MIPRGQLSVFFQGGERHDSHVFGKSKHSFIVTKKKKNAKNVVSFLRLAVGPPIFLLVQRKGDKVKHTTKYCNTEGRRFLTPSCHTEVSQDVLTVQEGK